MNIEFCGYHLDIDDEKTKKIYDQIEFGGSEECTCEYCQNYCLVIESVFPTEIIDFFVCSGIDKKKDAEVFYYNEESPNFHNYGGEYYLIGKVLRHPKKPVKIGKHFNFAFTEPSPLAQDGFRIKGAICFTFDTMLPWKLENV